MSARKLAFLLSIMLISSFSTSASTSTQTSVEESRLDRALSVIPTLGKEMSNKVFRDLSAKLESGAWQSSCGALGSQLWHWAKQSRLDDRLLYWGRLQTLAQIRKRAAEAAVTAADLARCLTKFELASRGHANLEWLPDHYRVLVSGFDPFLLDENIAQSNPSGYAALRLDDQILKPAAGAPMHVRTVTLPVRFLDFDQGVLESLLEPLLAEQAIDAFVSISMGRDQFDLERFPGRRRSASALDNNNSSSGGIEVAPIIPSLKGLPLVGDEFLEFSLPASRMTRVIGRWKVRDNRQITTVEGGTFAAKSLQQLDGQVAVRGSGGGYLSNEVAYRALNLRQRMRSQIVMGHIHTPRMTEFDKQFLADSLEQIIGLLEAIPE